jgi:hypothetical protein
MVSQFYNNCESRLINDNIFQILPVPELQKCGPTSFKAQSDKTTSLLIRNRALKHLIILSFKAFSLNVDISYQASYYIAQNSDAIADEDEEKSSSLLLLIERFFFYGKTKGNFKK